LAFFVAQRFKASGSSLKALCLMFGQHFRQQSINLSHDSRHGRLLQPLEFQLVSELSLVSILLSVQLIWTQLRRCAMNNKPNEAVQEPMRVAAVQDVTKVYRLGGQDVKALAGVSLEFKQGDFVAIMGSSGSGKSTLLNLLGCLDRPTTGHYLLGGRDVATLSDEDLSRVRGRYLGFVFQSYNLIQQLSVVENIMVPLSYQKPIRPDGRELSIKLATLVGLAGRLDHRPNQLSGGQQQRVAIARALVNNPHVILADEPTGNLDTATSYEIMDLLDVLNKTGRTIVMVTHEPDIAQRAKTVITLRDGLIQSVEQNRA
jgi:putative ABC transport system ATP-binding protein